MSTLQNRLDWRNDSGASSGESTVSRLGAAIQEVNTTLGAFATVAALSSYYDGVTPLDKPGNATTPPDYYSEAGYGTCIVIHDYPAISDNKKHTCLVFDLGNDSSAANAGTAYEGCGSTLMHYLNNNGITTIDALFISHYHGDHFQIEALNNLYTYGFTITEIVLPHTGIWSYNKVNVVTHKNGRGAELQNYEKFTNTSGTYSISAIAATELTDIRKPANEGDLYTYGEDNNIEVACYNVSADKFESGDYYNWCYNENYNVRHPNGTDPGCNYNNFSMVNVVTVAGKKIVITGDIMAPAVKANLDIISSSDIIFVPHHGLDCFTASDALNRLSAKYAVINSAYDGINTAEGDNPNTTGEDGPGHLTRMSRGFAAELLKHGCIVTSTYAGYTKNDYENTYNKKIVKFKVSIDNVILEETPSYAGNGLLPQAIQPYSESIPLKDDGITPKYSSYEGTPENCGKFTTADEFVRSLPFGEYITLFDSHAAAFKDALPFKYEGRKFKLIVEPASFRGKGKTQIAYHIGTSANPEILMRTENTEKSIGDGENQVEDSWTPWRSFKTTDAKLTVVNSNANGNAVAMSESELDAWLSERMTTLANNDPDEFVFKLSNIGDFEDDSLSESLENIVSALDWTWTGTLNKTGADWATLTAHCGFANGTTIQKRCIPKSALGKAEAGHEWQAFEFVNPPMYNGFEFRTVERYFASPVYTKLIEMNDGTNGLSNNTYTTTLSSEAKILRIDARSNGVPVTQITFSDQSITVTFPSNPTALGTDAYVQLWYYKPGTDIQN